MRFRALLAAIVATSVLFFVTAPAASAASCTATTGQIWWTGQFSYNANLACDGVNGVQFYDGTTSFPGFIWDASVGLRHNASSGGGYLYGVYANYQTTYGVSNWGLWCPGNVHSVSSYFSYRIRNANGSTWGSRHDYGGLRYELIC